MIYTRILTGEGGACAARQPEGGTRGARFLGSRRAAMSRPARRPLTAPQPRHHQEVFASQELRRETEPDEIVLGRPRGRA
jgi:hypothetical protein